MEALPKRGPHLQIRSIFRVPQGPAIASPHLKILERTGAGEHRNRDARLNYYMPSYPFLASAILLSFKTGAHREMRLVRPDQSLFTQERPESIS